jgi:hypothetical protein
MKKITLVSFALSTTLIACGGGDPKSASSKPDSLFPEGYVPPASVSSSSSSAGSGIVNQTIPYHENFDGASTTRAFFSANYKALNTDASLPFYFPTGGFLDEFGNPSPTATSWITADANHKLRIGNGRLSLGQTKLEVNTTTADTSIPTWGEFDLSKDYKVSFCVVEVSTPSSSNFEIYVDNNTTGGNNSIYGAGNASRILQVATHTLVPGTRQEVTVPKASGERLIGSANSFFQFRVSSGGYAVIDDLVVEYAGQPHNFALPACVAETTTAPLPEVPPTTPAAPTIIAGDAELVASWASVGVDVTYELKYNTVDDLTSAMSFSGNPVTGTSAQLTGLINGQEYFVWVKATNVIGSSDFSPSASGTPVAPVGTDTSKEWGFNSFNYSELLAGSSGTVVVTLSETPYEADGLKIFLNNGTALRYRFDSNAWNYNGNSFRSSASLVPAVGEVVAELRAYIGVPVVASRAATITFTVKQTGSGQTGKAVIVDQDNKVVSVTDISDSTVTVDIPVVLAEGHSTSELRAFYSREGASSGGMDITMLVKSYADSPIESSSSSSEASSSEASSSSSAPESSSASSQASSSAASSDMGGGASSDAASSSSAASSAAGALMTEDFSAVDAATFFTAAYKALPEDAAAPFYVATSGSTRITVADGALSMNNARFTLGDKGGATSAGVQPNGVLDLSKPYRLSFTITAAAGTGNFQVYVDNNTTSAGSSIHAAIGSTASRLLQATADSITTFPHEVVIESDVGTATSFFQIRTDSSVTNLTIDDLKLEYQ